MTREVIAKEVNEAEFFGVIADETTDISTKNQLSTFLRYVHKGVLKERFWGFDNVSALSGQYLLLYDVSCRSFIILYVCIMLLVSVELANQIVK